MGAIKVLLTDDHLLVRSGIKNILEQASDIKVVAEASNGQEAITAVKLQRPDVVLLDIQMPVMGVDTCKQLKDVPNKILMLTVHEEELYALRLIEAGALGYITKDDIDDCITVRLVSKVVFADQCKIKQYINCFKKGKPIYGALEEKFRSFIL